MSPIIEHIFRFVSLLLIQSFLLKNLGYYNLLTPFIYILFILRLPSRISEFLLYTLSFFLGLMVDMAYNTPGLHASACLVLAFVRNLYLKIALSKDKADYDSEINMGTMGTRWYFIYITFMLFIHHFSLFLLEVFRLNDLFFVIIRTILSSAFSLFLIAIIEFLFSSRKVKI